LHSQNTAVIANYGYFDIVHRINMVTSATQVLKKAPPKHKAPIGMKLKVT